MNVLDPSHSPNSDNDVRRLNKLPIYLLGGTTLLVLFGIFYALNSRQTITSDSSDQQKGTISNNAMVNKLISGVGDGVVDSTPGETIIIDNTTPSIDSVTSEEPQLIPNLPMDTPPTEEVDPEAERIAALVRDFRQQNYYDAIVARTAIESLPSYQDNNQQQPQEISNPQIASILQSLSAQGIGTQAKIDGSESLLADRDPNLRLRKEAFTSNTDNPYKYSNAVRMPQLTPYEIRVGTIIPAVMISGINSDLPGDIIAQVSQNVRDTKTGKHILIPVGSKLIGRYDSHIAMGQERVMIAWYRLQFPDASVFNLDNMGAVDLAGYAGMHDKVNNHTWKIFKNAFLLSIIGAGAQIAIGDGGDDKDSPLNVSKSEMGRQFGQVGTEMIKRNMNIQPTLEIRPGYLFNIMVNKDLILSPYQ